MVANLVVAVLCGVYAARASGQRADQNAVTAAEDAFGTQTGNQSIGLYSLNDARGFNPQQAGNLRLEGLYFNQTSPYINQCLIRDTTMRVGIAAQSVSFPAPTGVADLRLYVPGSDTRLSAVYNMGSYGEAGILVEGQGRLSDQLNGAACGAYNRDFLRDEAHDARNASAGLVLAWHPTTMTEVLPFWSVMSGNDHRVVPQVYTDGFEAPPAYRPTDLATDGYSYQKWRLSNGGILLRHAFDPAWALSAGVFTSLESDSRTYVEEFLSVLPDRSAERVLDIVPPLHQSVTSGELRLTRRTVQGIHARTLALAIRGRSADREYGGDALLDYGRLPLDSPGVTQLLPIQTTPTSRDATRQLDGALSYEERWNGFGSFAVGLLKSSYSRTITDPASAPSSDRTQPWLGSVRFTANASRQLTFYGSYLQGLEDSQLAPTTATNRGEPPPATRTHQSDVGLRYAPDARLALILGGFEIDKAYFNLDAQSLYTRLGEIRHRGVESSVTYAADGITVVAGGVWLRPHVERVLPEPGATGTVPIGPTPLTLTLNLDLAPAAWKPFAAQLQLNRWSGGEATADDSARLPQLTTVTAGARYENKFRGHPLSVRLDVLNLTNAEGIRLNNVGQLLPVLGRRYELVIAIDE